MLVDLDHLLADPIFQANRCGINFHPLHTYWAMLGYVALLFFRWPFRVIGIGLLFHMLTDFVDCFWTYLNCEGCVIERQTLVIMEVIGGVFGVGGG